MAINEAADSNTAIRIPNPLGLFSLVIVSYYYEDFI
jgi:hypothetical protein